MLVSVILPTIRTGSVSAAIDAVLRQTVDDWELVVVAQGDDTELVRLLEGYHSRDQRVSFVHIDEKNASNARNVGMAAARGELFAFTDDDCEVAPDWIAVIQDVFTSHPDIGYLGGEVVPEKSARPWWISTCPSAHVIEATYHPSRDDHKAPDGFYMIGANIVVRRSVAEQIGPYDVVLGAGARFASCEDQDFGFRAEALDVGFMTTKRLVVNHSTGRRYGLRQFVKHQRNYALGRGAWVAKLRMWGHPMGAVWSTPPTRSDIAKQLATRPHMWLLDLFADHHKQIAAAEYEANYEIGDDIVSRPRSGSAVGPPISSAA